MRTQRAILVIMLMAVVISATGCAGRDASETSDGAVGGVYGDAAQVAPDNYDYATIAPQAGAEKYASVTEEARGAAEALTTPEPMIIRNARLELRVKDVSGSLAALRKAVAVHKGEIADLTVDAGSGAPMRGQELGKSDAEAGPQFASVTIRVPADQLDALSVTIAKFGDVLSQSESSNDVTEQAIDLEARLKNLRAEEARLRTFLDRATKVSDLLEVQRELARVRGDIEAMDAQLTYLKRQVAKATLQVTLSKPGSVIGPDDPWFGLREAFTRGVQGALSVVQGLITFFVAALPLILLLAITLWILTSRLRKRRAQRAAGGAANEVPGSASANDDSV